MVGGALFQREIKITDSILVRIPTVGEIIEHLDEYYALAALIIATPTDLMVQLDDIGIDWSKIGDFELFCTLWSEIQDKHKDSPHIFSLFFGNLDISGLQPAPIGDTGRFIIQAPKKDENRKKKKRDPQKKTIMIDSIVYNSICEAIRMMLGLQKNERVPGNEAARKFIIETERRRQKREARKKKDPAALSQIENLIISLVNNADCPYDFNTILGLTMLQFNESVRQVSRKYNVDNLMIGVYSGTVDTKNMNHDDLTWIKVGESSSKPN